MGQILPHYLYKYCRISSAEDLAHLCDVLINKRVFASPLGELNDPLEGCGVSVRPAVAGGTMPSIIGKRHSIDVERYAPYRVLSLTETPSSPQMWAHYANGYGGACLQFDPQIMDVAAEKVLYSSQNIRLSEHEVPEELADEIEHQSILTKHLAWSYEQEWRAILKVDRVDEKGFIHCGLENPTALIVGHEINRDVSLFLKWMCEQVGIAMYQSEILDWSYQVRIIPFEFEVDVNGEDYEKHVREECKRRGIAFCWDW